ncbi:MAG: hypothetical protein D3914_04890, partial [Candidatus Electrothrix sp. LOE2]|nr:hypothetical protein [Candidatus Electrothrix sp. LOE2]
CSGFFVVKKGQIPAYLQGIVQAVLGMRKMRKKRKEISKHDFLNIAEFAACLSAAENAVVESIMRRRKAEGKNNWLPRCYIFLFCQKKRTKK